MIVRSPSKFSVDTVNFHPDITPKPINLDASEL